MMRTIAVLTMLMIIASPAGSLAFRHDRPVGRVLDTIPRRNTATHRHDTAFHHRRQAAAFTPAEHPFRKNRHDRHDQGRHRPVVVWPSSTTVVQKIQPIIVTIPPSPREDSTPPEPERVWVPPKMGTRTEPGYWDYGIRKVWMGDYWRYEQDMDRPIWVPEKMVRVVEQAGYWKSVE